MCTQTVRDILLKKHPIKQPPKHSTTIKSDVPLVEPHPVLFQGQLIHDTILRMDGTAGPSGLDVVSWKHICSSFKGASTDLCEALAVTSQVANPPFMPCVKFLNPQRLKLSSWYMQECLQLPKSPSCFEKHPPPVPTPFQDSNQYLPGRYPTTVC